MKYFVLPKRVLLKKRKVKSEIRKYYVFCVVCEEMQVKRRFIRTETKVTPFK